MADIQPKKKVNRAKARLQRRAENMDAQRKEAAAEAAVMPDLKAQEAEQINSKLLTMDLVEHDITADGHCLYSAFADQLSLRCQVEETYKSLRTQTAEYIRSHPDDFLPFLLSDEQADTSSIDSYADEIKDTPRWGGELEIIALARRYSVAVVVVQAKGGQLSFEEQNSRTVTLARYEHMYSLGAHYNSLRPK